MYKDTSYGALMDKAVCWGNSYLTESLLKRLGIISKMYIGDFENPDDEYGHAWNSVLVDGVWHHCDSTLDRYIDKYGCPAVAMVSDDDINRIGYILTSNNRYPCSSITIEERAAIGEKLNTGIN